MSCEPREKNLIRAVLLIIKAHQRRSYRFAARFACGGHLLSTSEKCWRFLGLPVLVGFSCFCEEPFGMKNFGRELKNFKVVAQHAG